MADQGTTTRIAPGVRSAATFSTFQTAHLDLVARLAATRPHQIVAIADRMDIEERAEHVRDVLGAVLSYVGTVVTDTNANLPIGLLDGAYVMDRKTTGSTPGPYYFDGFAPDNQMSLYALASKIVFKTPVKGVIIDAAQVVVGFTRFSRGFTHRTDAQLDEWLANTWTWLETARGYALADFWPMNDKSCHHFGGCVFRKVCSKSPEVRERFLESDFTRIPWNPLEPR